MLPDAVLASLLSPLPEILGAVVAGGLIGLEREWRGRSAGFRTHILVALAACVLMQAAVRQDAWTLSGLAAAQITTDPVRMAHGRSRRPDPCRSRTESPSAGRRSARP